MDKTSLMKTIQTEYAEFESIIAPLSGLNSVARRWMGDGRSRILWLMLLCGNKYALEEGLKDFLACE